MTKTEYKTGIDQLLNEIFDIEAIVKYIKSKEAETAIRPKNLINVKSKSLETRNQNN